MAFPLMRQPNAAKEMAAATLEAYPLTRFLALTATPTIDEDSPFDENRMPDQPPALVKGTRSSAWGTLPGGGEKKTCVVADFGPNYGQSNTKTVEIDDNLGQIQCPRTVDKTNWLRGENYNDVFEVSMSGNKVTATRTDRSLGWNFPMSFECCQQDSDRAGSQSS